MAQDEAFRLQNQLCFPIYLASKEITGKYTQLLKQYDLTYTQYITMMVLWDRKECNVKELGQKLYLDSGTLTPLLKKLESKGYIERVRSAEDERNLLVRVTEEGTALRERALSVPAGIACCVHLEPAEAQEMYRLLYKILGGMTE